MFGNYETKKFTDFYGEVDTFIAEYNNNGIPATISDLNATTLYYLLYARYGNSHIANLDENQFKYRLWSTIFMYGPSWEKRLEIQYKLRNLTDDEIRVGSRQLTNHAFNPSTEPGINTESELSNINEQSSTGFRKGKLDAYAWLYDVIKTDVTESFLTKFKTLFLTVVEPQRPLWYVTDISEEEEY